MKRFTAVVLWLLAITVQAQENPVTWTFTAEEKGNGEAELIFKAKIDKGWHLYTTTLPEGGPVPTSFTFHKSPGYEKVGKITDKGFITEYDPQFDMKLTYYEHQAVFRQRIKIKGTGPQKITGELEFMVCDKEKCLPPDILDFSFTVNAKGGADTSTTGTLAPDTTLNPIQWKFSTTEKSPGQYEFVAEASLNKGWHLYAVDLGKEAESAGPYPTSFSFHTSEGIKLTGKLQEPVPIVKYDPNFMMNLRYHENVVKFTQTFQKTGTGDTLKGKVEFMVCNDEKCLPNDVIEFTIDLKTGQPILSSGKKPTPKSDIPIIRISGLDLDKPLSDCGTAPPKKEKSLMGIFILGFLGGLIALLTPCVFPMIPLTVSFFTKSSGSRRRGIMNANMYGFFIFAIYIILSLPFHFLDNIDPEILNTISTNIWLNLLFFVVFIVFAISFFGYFEITMPASLANKADSASEIGGLIGIFFMALTLALVSFSCTGPILGSLLAGSLSSDGGAMQLTVGMGGFGLALALPFTIFALFPGMMKSLPKSGGWLNSVKVFLGFIEVALAIKFLSNADLVDHWGLVKIEVFLGIWILVGIGLMLYLLGKIRFPHDSPPKKLGLVRISLATVTFAFVMYLASGFIYDEQNKGFRSLSLLSGLAPPSGYSWIYPNHCPLSLNCFHDYQEGIEYAKKVNKPVMVDFTGWACVNCRKMEENVWNQPEILKRLRDDYVLISLYVDDREMLPEKHQFEYITSDGRKKKVRNVGNLWATFQTENFKVSSQPYYVLLSPDEKLLNNPVAYTPDVSEYQHFLQCGLETFRKSIQ